MATVSGPQVQKPVNPAATNPKTTMTVQNFLLDCDIGAVLLRIFSWNRKVNADALGSDDGDMDDLSTGIHQGSGKAN
jgi:hypothetical protein